MVSKKSAFVGDSPFRVKVSQRFFVLSMVACVLAAFAVGRTARVILLINPQKELLLAHQAMQQSLNEGGSPERMRLPNPVLKDKPVPQTTYTSMNFDTAKSAAINSRWVVSEEGKQHCVDVPNGDCPAMYENDESSGDPDLTEYDEDEVHMPKGQHLLIDIEHVDASFLDSEERLAGAMLDLVSECGLTLLSYHCHRMTPMGVSCAGVLLESHVSFHTWPVEGVITLDLFTCGDDSLLPIVPLAKSLFSVPRENESTKPRVVWAHKFRGFEDGITKEVAESTDLFDFPIGQMLDYKEKVASADTKFQRIDIYDVLRPNFQTLDDYERSLSNDGSYQAQHPELFLPDRVVFMDGVLQSRRSGDAAYHEALVHPTMFAHSNPKRVAIIGGGEGATLREVLKHNTVEKLVMIEIDEMMVNVSREYLPDWSDCSYLVGGENSCFEDDRVEMYYEDAFAWFIDRYGEGSSGENEPFDVIIMDALDPQVQKDFVDALYDEGPFLRSLARAMSEDGIFVAQMGEAPGIFDPSEEHSISRNRVKFIQRLTELGFETVRDYEEGRSGFFDPWQFIAAFNKMETKAQWFASPAMMEYKIRERLIPTISGGSSLRYFDGAQMMSYVYPSKASESVFCRRGSTPIGCDEMHGFDPARENLSIDLLEVKTSSLGKHAGRGVFATVDIPQKSYVGLEDLVHNVHMSPSTFALIISMDMHHDDYLDPNTDWFANEVEIYTHGYGHYFSKHGSLSIYVDATIHCFINHGCNGSNNVGHGLEITEAAANPEELSAEVLERYMGTGAIYNPFLDRQTHFFSSATPLRDIASGEELFDNYLGMIGLSEDGWKEDVEGLKQQCDGGMGPVNGYENKWRN